MCHTARGLAEDGTLYPVVDEVLARYTAWLSVPLQQPTFRESSLILARQSAWAEQQNGIYPVSAWLKDGKIYLYSRGDAEVPVTGADTGSWYGGDRATWVSIEGGATTEATQAEETSLSDSSKYNSWKRSWKKWRAKSNKKSTATKTTTKTEGKSWKSKKAVKVSKSKYDDDQKKSSKRKWRR
ncbi:MAG: hypothetical protein KC502_14820 [Myxococcales bacterium]|nr:hypothetical protein [Myxococcales bacterium]